MYSDGLFVRWSCSLRASNPAVTVPSDGFTGSRAEPENCSRSGSLVFRQLSSSCASQQRANAANLARGLSAWRESCAAKHAVGLVSRSSTQVHVNQMIARSPADHSLYACSQ